MSYQVLARKWRPANFTQVIGQPHVVDTLTHALSKQRLHHAYLFTGTRGVGKTTLARIFAKCLNCETGITATPCEQCSSCQEVAQGRFIDLIEVDAASRTKVEDTRDLLDNVQYAPTRGRYKIYLIDEVHMLSNHSFNALLKTLEEPPEHVIFLLATTDPQKLPITVLSRCMQLHLKNMSQTAIIQQLSYILTQEAIAFEQSALHYLAQAANGSMRDALSLLDQAIAHGQGQVVTEKVLAMLGCISNSYILDLLTAIQQNSPQTVLQLCEAIAELAADFRQVTQDLLHALSEIALLQIVPTATLSDVTQQARLAELAQSLSKENVQLYYQIALLGLRDLSYAPSTKSGFIMLMLRMLAFTPVVTAMPPIKTTPVITTKPVVTAPSIVTPAPTATTPPVVTAPPVATLPALATPMMAAEPLAAPTTTQSWGDILSQLSLTGPLRILAENCMLEQMTENNIMLSLSSQQAPLLTPKNQARLAELLSTYFQKPIQLKVTIAQQAVDSPANLAQKAATDRHKTAKENLEKDSALQAILQQFNATIDPSTIKSNEE